jgi:hypothetical protein
MRRLAFLSATLLLVLLTSYRTRLYADSCSCPWQVRQLTSTSSDCTTATSNAQRNAQSWATFACGATPCEVVWTDLGCSTDSSGTATDTSLINFKCC